MPWQVGPWKLDLRQTHLEDFVVDSRVIGDIEAQLALPRNKIRVGAGFNKILSQGAEGTLERKIANESVEDFVPGAARWRGIWR